jgi:hypothetical protein
MTDEHTYAWTDPVSDIVALHGGPQDLRWFFYRDWLITRRASRRGRYPLSSPCGTPRCYAPTTRWTGRTDGSTSPMRARVWHYLPPTQWAEWGQEYLTPDEQAADQPVIPIQRTGSPDTPSTPAQRSAPPHTIPPTAETDGEVTALVLPLWTEQDTLWHRGT